jgi:hypothetical protein
MSLKFLNEEVKAEILRSRFTQFKVLYRFKNLSIWLISERNCCIVQFHENLDIEKKICLDNLNKLWAHLMLNDVISDELEQKLQQDIDDILPEILMEIYKSYNGYIQKKETWVKEQVEELEKFKKEYDSFKETYARELMLI